MLPERIKMEMKQNGRVVMLEPFTVKIPNFNKDGKALEITIPAGYTSDLASVPWFGRCLWPYASSISVPAIVHDFLCDENKRDRNIISRKDADKAFLILLRENGVRAPWSLWLSVRLFAIFAGKK